MPKAGQTTADIRSPRNTPTEETKEALSLVLVWAATERARVGEVLFPRSGDTFGRAEGDDGEQRAKLVRQQPKKNVPVAGVGEPQLSRRQLRFEVSDEEISVESIGKRALRVGDTELRAATVTEGDVLEVEDTLLFYCVRRPLVLPAGPAEVAPHEFGRADAQGIVGESPSVWALRSSVAFAAKRNAHVLITGPSGTGKELVAQAIHAQSPRASRELVARNAATFPGGLIDAELFGNMANYPNAGMPERPGLVGQADRGTLFLDEIGELPADLQAHLLRLLDSGEYQRLGDSRRRVADLRVVAATNRSVEELKHDLAARLALRLQAPGLDERREDVVLVARHLLRRAALNDPQIAQGYFEGGTAEGEPRMTPELARALTLHTFTTHVRELETLLWQALSTSRGGELELTDAVRRLVREVSKPSRELTAEDVRQALARHNGIKDKAWRELRLPSRHALHRLMKKLNVAE